MNKTIHLRIKKEIDRASEAKVLKLKGTLITKGYTEIIHIKDESEDFYLNTFSTDPDKKKEAENYVLEFIASNGINDSISLIDNVKSNFILL
ncbi:hypothetical protein [uncultured Flavobacterium sp.]|uniref:hypothetical protein n=1 Tax=uncultured Flavobacterium sp. TaxID=165435 RepID=UPI00308184EE